MKSLRLLSAVAVAVMLSATSAFAKATITIVPGVGFSDTTAAAPVGGNPGTTIGEQRLNAFQKAAEIWGNALESNVEIIVNASFQSLDCTATSAVLGSAGPTRLFANFDNSPRQNTFYPVALASSLAGRDLLVTPPATMRAPSVADIVAQFNSRIDDASCLGDTNWYYGFDGNNGKDSDFLAVLLHELGHGLGFTSGVNVDTGAFRNSNLPSIFDTFVVDDTVGLHWDQMTTAQRFASVTNDQNLVFDGPSVVENAAKLLGPTPVLQVNSPASIAKVYTIGSASFGPVATVAGLTGNIVAAIDGPEIPATDDPPGTDYTLNGCGPFTNASAVQGRFALVNRGQCTFVTKALNAQAAGAIGVIIVDNVVRLTPPGMGGSDSSVRIPVYSVTRPDGEAIRGQLNAGVGLTLFADMTRLVGADLAGRVKLFAPPDIQPGSSISHWDTSATPNLLMEPNINDDLLPVLDLTLNFMLDIGWKQSSSNPITPTPPTTGRRSLRRGR